VVDCNGETDNEIPLCQILVTYWVQKPLATVVVVRGLLSATFLALFVLPALYLLFGREQPSSVPDSASVRTNVEHAAGSP
jgi:hypothetical protein